MLRSALPILSVVLACVPALAAAQTPVRWLSQSQETSSQYPVETSAMEQLRSEDFTVDRSEFQALGIKMADGLRLIRAGTFDVASIQVGLVASDDPFLEGIDLIGVSTNLEELRASVDAYRDVFAARLEERFGKSRRSQGPEGPLVHRFHVCPY